MYSVEVQRKTSTRRPHEPPLQRQSTLTAPGQGPSSVSTMPSAAVGHGSAATAVMLQATFAVLTSSSNGLAPPSRFRIARRAILFASGRIFFPLAVSILVE